MDDFKNISLQTFFKAVDPALSDEDWKKMWQEIMALSLTETMAEIRIRIGKDKGGDSWEEIVKYCQENGLSDQLIQILKEKTEELRADYVENVWKKMSEPERLRITDLLKEQEIKSG
jgi:hypothetical protein